MKTLTQRVNESVGYIEPTIKELIINKLCNAYKEELAAFYYYFTTAEFLCGSERKSINEFFEEAAKDELYDHAEWLLKRISQLGGCPSQITNFSEVHNATHQYVNPIVNNGNISISTSLNDCKKMELDAIETYRELEEITRNVDPVTNCKVKAILADEEEHLQELEDFICDIENNSCEKSCCGCCVEEPVTTCTSDEPTITSMDDIDTFGSINEF